MTVMRSSIGAGLFRQPHALESVALLRCLIGGASLILALLGPYDARFFSELTPHVTAAPLWVGPLRVGTIVTASAVTVGFWTTVSVPSLLCALGALCYVVQRPIPLFNYNAHLLFMLAALSIVRTDVRLSIFGKARGPGDERRAAAALVFCQFIVGCTYLQAALSKLLHGGLEWYLQGTTIWAYAVNQGTAVGRWLAGWPQLFAVFGWFTAIVEFLFLPAILSRRSRPWAAIAAIGFHWGIWAILNISFWHLWMLFPALFFSRRGLAKAASIN